MSNPSPIKFVCVSVFVFVAISLSVFSTFLASNSENSMVESRSQNSKTLGIVEKNWPIQVNSEDEFDNLGMFGVKWIHLEDRGLKIVVGIEELSIFSPTHHDFYGYVFNKQFNGWTRFFAVHLEGAGNPRIALGQESKYLEIRRQKTQSYPDGQLLFSMSLDAISDSLPFTSE